MLRRIMWLALATATTAACAADWWIPYAEVRGRGGDFRYGGAVHGFAPIVQGDCSLLFAQGEAGAFHQKTVHGGRHTQAIAGGGVGYRHLIGCNAFWGVAGFADWVRLDNGNQYVVGNVSAELVAYCLELRANAYIPSQKKHFISDESHEWTTVRGTEVLVQNGRCETFEEAMTGYDVEAGYNLELGCCGRLRGYAAYYQYSRHSLRDLYGPRLRLRYELDNVICCGTRLIAEGIYRYDNVRGSTGEGMVGLRIPFCQPKCCELRPTFRRMNDLVERDLGIIVQRHHEECPLEERQLANIFFIAEDALGSGSLEDPTGLDFAMEFAGAGDILFALSNNGPIFLDRPLTLKPGQRLYSFNDDATVPITFAQDLSIELENGGYGQATLIQRQAAPVIVAADNTSINGVRLENGSCGVQIANARTINIDDVLISGTRGAGLEFTAANMVQLQNVEVIDSQDVSLSLTDSRNISGNQLQLFAARHPLFAIQGGGNIRFENVTGSNSSAALMEIEGLEGPVSIGGAMHNESGQGIIAKNCKKRGDLHVEGVAITDALETAVSIANSDALVSLTKAQLSTVGGGTGVRVSGGSAAGDVRFTYSSLDQPFGGRVAHVTDTQGDIDLTGMCARNYNTTGIPPVEVTHLKGGGVTLGHLDIANTDTTAIHLEDNAGNFTLSDSKITTTDTGLGMYIAKGNKRGSVKVQRSTLHQPDGGKIVDISRTAGNIDLRGLASFNANCEHERPVSIIQLQDGKVAMSDIGIKNCDGTAVYLANNEAPITFDRSYFSTSPKGVGIQVTGGSDKGHVTVTDSHLTQARGGRAIRVKGTASDIDLRGLAVHNANTARPHPIAVTDLKGGSVQVSDVKIVDTTSTAVHLADNAGSFTMENSSITTADRGQGFAIKRGTSDGHVTVKKSSLAQRRAGGTGVSILETQANIDLAGLEMINQGTQNETVVSVSQAHNGNVRFGPITITDYKNSKATPAVKLTSNTVPITFPRLDVKGEGSNALFAEPNDVVRIAGGNIDVKGMPALHLVDTDLEVTLDTLTSRQSQGAGIVVHDASGKLHVKNGTKILEPKTKWAHFKGSLDLDTEFGDLDLGDK